MILVHSKNQVIFFFGEREKEGEGDCKISISEVYFNNNNHTYMQVHLMLSKNYILNGDTFL